MRDGGSAARYGCYWAPAISSVVRRLGEFANILLHDLGRYIRTQRGLCISSFEQELGVLPPEMCWWS
jgi:hypothetical protein